MSTVRPAEIAKKPAKKAPKKLAKKALKKTASLPAMKKGAAKSGKTRLLSGGNPQIAKGEGDAPVQAYLAAISDWKQAVARRIDALIAASVPKARKAVKWNSPFYGIEGQGWFLSFHVFARYVKVAFFRGTSLRPNPPGTSKNAEVRYLDVHEGDELDEAQLRAWFKQAAKLPGWDPSRPA